MKALKDLNTIPPNGWVHTVAETGFTIRKNSRGPLADTIQEHLRANGISLDLGTILRRIDEQICAKYPASCYTVLDSAKAPAKRGRRWSLTEVLRGMAAWFFDVNPKNYVDMGLVRKRAAICAACPKKVDSDACQSCSKSYQAMVHRVGNQRIAPLAPYNLRICDACGCFQAVKVQLNLETVLKRTPNDVRDKLHPSCWILKEQKETQP